MLTRRNFIKIVALGLSAFSSKFAIAAQEDASALGNFNYIYSNKNHKQEFYHFLTNVFHLFPEDKMHLLISDASRLSNFDEEVYKSLQKNIKGIKPFLSDLSYAIPALKKQKKVMAAQTKKLLSTKHIDGYLEIGSEGRYLDSLEEVLDINGDRFFMSEKKPTFSPIDIIDRGQLFKGGDWFSLNNYEPNISQSVPKNSMDLVTVFIGFHHCPPALREQYISSIRDVMKDDGVLILRDHNAHNEKMLRMVALAHDVFNMGTKETWKYNNQERRHFYSLAELDIMMNKFGFKKESKGLLQAGDPTLNTLMLYKKA